MPDYVRPGVYVEEVSSGARPIAAVGTSVAAFLGHVPDVGGFAAEPIGVNSYAAFEMSFATDPVQSTHLQYAVRGFFENGGGYAYVVPLDSADIYITAAHLGRLEPRDDVSLLAAPGFSDIASQTALITHCEARRDRLAVLHGPETVADHVRYLRPAEDGGLRPTRVDAGCAAFYAPWLKVNDAMNGAAATCPPSGHVCGIFARSDSNRGVWKAPANYGLRGVTGLSHTFDRADQGQLNRGGINLIRALPQGIRVWGARTLADRTSEYRYVSVRRLASMIETSLDRGLRWVVFEPNAEPLWRSVRRDVGTFLKTLWRQGALAGATPSQAYFVKCGQDTMSQADLDNGRLIVQIGIAPLKPAEFIILRTGQNTLKAGA